MELIISSHLKYDIQNGSQQGYARISLLSAPTFDWRIKQC